MTDKNEITAKLKTSTLAYTCAVVFILVLALGALPHLFTESIGDAGLLGDAFGMANAVFSALAFAGVICAILMQRSELELQRLDVATTRKVLEAQASAQEKSQEALNEQVNLLASAQKLSAINILLNQIEKELREPRSSTERNNLERKKRILIEQAENILIPPDTSNEKIQ